MILSSNYFNVMHVNADKSIISKLAISFISVFNHRAITIGLIMCLTLIARGLYQHLTVSFV